MEWQLGRQRNQIGQLEEEITLLMEQAGLNEVLFSRLLQLQANLAAADSLQDMLNRLQRWARDFGLAGANIRLFSDRWQIGAPSDFTHLALSRHAFEPLRIQRLGNRHHYLGSLNGPELLLLLPQAKLVGSVALSLLGDGDWVSLFFSSRDAQHYQQGMGTVMLTSYPHCFRAPGTLDRAGMTEFSASLAPQVEGFLRYLSIERQLSPLTVTSYRRQLSALMEIGEQRWAWLTGRRWMLLRSFVGLPQQTCGFTCFKPGITALRITQFSQTGWSASQGVLPANPAKGGQYARSGRHLPKNIDVDEVNKLLSIDLNDPLRYVTGPCWR